MTKPILTAAAILVGLTVAAPASAKIAHCVIESEGSSYDGPCNYVVARGGTFTVTALRSRYIGGETLSITVYMVRAGVAEVRGLTDAGINSRWGEARRSRRDRACWVGQDFSVCAY